MRNDFDEATNWRVQFYFTTDTVYAKKCNISLEYMDKQLLMVALKFQTGYYSTIFVFFNSFFRFFLLLFCCFFFNYLLGLCCWAFGVEGQIPIYLPSHDNIRTILILQFRCANIHQRCPHFTWFGDSYSCTLQYWWHFFMPIKQFTYFFFLFGLSNILNEITNNNLERHFALWYD